jgi:succinyl-CoA synthetase beta subunit
MKIHEYQAKELFSKYGIPVEKHTLCRTPSGAVSAYQRMGDGKAVIKAQVLTGGRGKAGGVKVVNNAEEAFEVAQHILSMEIKGFPVNQILVSEAIHIAAEYYISFTIDRNTRSVILMMSASGGMDIEEVARKNPEKIIRHAIDPFIGIPDYAARRFAFDLFPKMEQAGKMAVILQSLYKLFIETDASLVEVNQLVLTGKGELLAIDAKMVFDDNALYRHPDLLTLFHPTPEEKIEAEAKEKGISYVHMDGDIGCMVNGAGLAMATMDMIKP